jgi:hypothetical protein
VQAIARNRLAGVDATTGALTQWNPSSNGTVSSLALDAGGNVYAGGAFTTIGAFTRNRLAEIDNTGTPLAGWDPNANSDVNALAVKGSTVYPGGAFTTIGALVRNRIAAVDGAGIATAWNPNANGAVNAVAISPSAVFVGGSFSAIAGIGDHIAALDPANGATALPWSPGVAGLVSAIVPSGLQVIAGGSFATVGNLPQSNLALLYAPGVVGVEAPSEPGAGLASLRLSPNPAAGPVRIDYTLARAGHARISVFDLQGRLVARPLDEAHSAGRHSTLWHGSSRPLEAGLYLVRFEGPGQSVTRTLVVLK